MPMKMFIGFAITATAVTLEAIIGPLCDQEPVPQEIVLFE